MAGAFPVGIDETMCSSGLDEGSPSPLRIHRLPPGLSTMSARPRIDQQAHLLRRRRRRQGVREAQPLLAVVVAVGEEVLADEDAQPGTRPRPTAPARPGTAARRRAGAAAAHGPSRRRRSARSSRRRTRTAGRRRPAAAWPSRRPRCETCSRARQSDCRRAATNSSGTASVWMPARMLKASASKLPNSTACGVDVDVEGEHAAQPQAQRLGAPAAVSADVAEQLLDQQQPEHRQGQPGEKAGAQDPLVVGQARQEQGQRRHATGGHRQTRQQTHLATWRFAQARLQQGQQEAEPGAVAHEVGRSAATAGIVSGAQACKPPATPQAALAGDRGQEPAGRRTSLRPQVARIDEAQTRRHRRPAPPVT